jgi:predicted membrane GTPase involved in stress response
MIDVPEEYIGTVIEKLGPRRSELLEMKNPGRAWSVRPSGSPPEACLATGRSS